MADDDAQLLREFLRGRDVHCPNCDYNLRDLSEPLCPECREELALSVGFRKPRIVWFLVTVTPGLFSGIAACFLLIPVMGVFLSGNPPPPWPILIAEGFGWLSVGTALVLIRYRHTFLQQPQARQRTWAIVAWGLHVGMFLMLAASLILLN